MELDKVMKLVNNIDKVRSLLAQINTLLDVGGETEAVPTEPAKRRGRPRKAKTEDLNFE